MRELKQGTLYGFDIVLKVPDDFDQPKLINENTLEKYIKQQGKIEIEKLIEKLKDNLL